MLKRPLHWLRQGGGYAEISNHSCLKTSLPLSSILHQNLQGGCNALLATSFSEVIFKSDFKMEIPILIPALSEHSNRTRVYIYTRTHS